MLSVPWIIIKTARLISSNIIAIYIEILGESYYILTPSNIGYLMFFFFIGF